MDLMTFFDINHTLVNIPIGGGYAMSWIEAVGNAVWFAVYLVCEPRKNH